MTIELPGGNLIVASNIMVLEMPKVEIEFIETPSGVDQFSFEPAHTLVTSLKVMRILRGETSWKDWMRTAASNGISQRTVTLQAGTSPAIVLGETFPVSYHIERGRDGFFYEILSLKAVTYSLE